MTLKKKKFSADEIEIFEKAVICKRGDCWQFRMMLNAEGKYTRLGFKACNQSTAEDKAKLRYRELMAQQLQGKTYFSLTAKDAVELYLKQRWRDIEAILAELMIN